MKEIIEQLINQIEEDQKLSFNTKAAYKSDLNELIDYVVSVNSQLVDVNQTWVKSYLRRLEETNQERNSLNRKASTFRLFLKFLYRNKMAPTNYSLIVNNYSVFEKSDEQEIETGEMRKIIEGTTLQLQDRLILLFIGRLGLNATEIAYINIHQIDFENRLINFSDTRKIYLPLDVFSFLREYLLEVRSTLLGSDEHLNLFLTEKGKPVDERDIYRLIKELSSELNLSGKLTTRNLKKLSEEKIDVLSMQREVLRVVSSPVDISSGNGNS